MNFQTLKDYFQEFIECNQHKIMFLNEKDDIFEEFKVIDAINFLEEKDKEIEKLKRHIEAINRWIDSNIEAGNIYCYDTTPFPKLENKK